MIVTYELTEDKEKNNIVQYYKLRMKPIFIILLVMLCVAVFAIVFGYCVAKKDANLLASGYSMLAFSLLGIILMLVIGNRLVKMYLNDFKINSENGKALMKFELANDIITLTNVTKGNVRNYATKDIVAVNEHRDIIVVNLTTKQQILLPNIDDIRCLLKK